MPSTTPPAPMSEAESAAFYAPKHTAGPWRWSDEYRTEDGRRTQSQIGGGGYGILSCDGLGNFPEFPADAALREVVRLSDRKHDAWDAAHAAIARAEVRS